MHVSLFPSVVEHFLGIHIEASCFESHVIAPTVPEEKRQWRPSLDLDRLPLPPAEGASSDSIAFRLPDLPLVPIEAYGHHSQGELQYMLVARDDRIADMELEREQHMRNIRELAKRNARLDTQVVAARQEITDLCQIINCRPGLRNVSSYAAYNMALRRNSAGGHIGAQSVVALMAGAEAFGGLKKQRCYREV